MAADAAAPPLLEVVDNANTHTSSRAQRANGQRPGLSPRTSSGTATPASGAASTSSVASGDTSTSLTNGHDVPRSNTEYLRITPSSTSPQVSKHVRRETASSKAHEESDDDEQPVESGWMRHGWESQHTAEQLRELTTNFYMYFNDKRHETGGNPKDPRKPADTQEWRMRDRLKTVSAILAICLNIGVDPPDAFKTNPCAKLECWVDPATVNMPQGTNAINVIGKNLQAQYELLSMRTRYKLLQDPTVEETKKYCSTLRRNAKDERILYHYNGHGVPKPTPSGEIWVFNKNYTQYIPISLYDLQNWLGAPSIFVWDCSNAGLIIPNFNKFVAQHNAENEELKRREPQAQLQNFNDCIHLAACAEKEILPTNPQLPADLFTSCLTTPVEIAVRFFILCNPLPNELTPEDARSIPGKASERRTPIGELNWVFTAITDTIAWNALPKPLFKKLFRQDLMVAALFRNFLLAQRIMRKYGCHPQSYPPIPDTHNDPLWASWDLAIEMVLAQLPALKHAHDTKQTDYLYLHSDFFAEQLTAFEIYLDQSAIERKEPEQLPVVLQVLLSQVHRLRALILLSKFLDLGPWAVNSALCIGIFPYVLKLLQSQAIELKPVMVFIWARILAVDQSCQQDLLKDNGYQYFVNILNPGTGIPIREVSEHRAMCAFIVAMFCRDFPQGQAVAHSAELVESCLSQVSWQDIEHPLLRQWSCLCLSMLWKDYPDAKWAGIRSAAHFRLCDVAWDPVPEVRAAVLHALTNFIGIPDLTEQVSQIEEGIASRLLLMTNDGSTIVRKELVVFFSAFVVRHKTRFIVAAYEQMTEEVEAPEKKPKASSISPPNGSISERVEHEAAKPVSAGTVISSVWKHILILSVDPDAEVAQDASVIVDFVFEALMRSPLGAHAQSYMDEILRRNTKVKAKSSVDLQHYSENSRPLASPASPTKSNSKPDGYFSLGMKRTASVAASLKNLAFGTYPKEVPGTPDSMNEKAGENGSIKGGRNDRWSGSSRGFTSGDWSRFEDSHIRPQTSLHHPTRTPLPKSFKYRSAEERKNLPLSSQFLDWSIEYFREPQMKQNEADEPGSTDYNERLWRRNRNEKILEATQKLKEQAGSSGWGNHVGYFDNGVQPMRMCFHQYDNHLVITDDKDIVRVWDWERQKPLNRFSNGNPPGSEITGTEFINEDDQALLMTGSSDGVIKIFRNYDDEEKAHVVSAFRALTDLVPSNQNAGLVFDWLQGRGWILVAGDSKVIRVWNAATEICTNDIPARSNSCITSLSSDQVEGNIFSAGFGDGAVRIYDQRERPMRARIMQWKEHKAWVSNVHMQRGGQRELLSGSRDGEVKLWDIRMQKSLRTILASRDGLRCLSVHEHAPVFATGTERHHIKVFNMDGSFLSAVEPSGSFLSQNRAAPIATTMFHPHRMMLATAALNDRHVYLFSCAGSGPGGAGGHNGVNNFGDVSGVRNGVLV